MNTPPGTMLPTLQALTILWDGNNSTASLSFLSPQKF